MAHPSSVRSVARIATIQLPAKHNQRGATVPAEGGDFSNATDSPYKSSRPGRHSGERSLVERERCDHARAGRRVGEGAISSTTTIFGSTIPCRWAGSNVMRAHLPLTPASMFWRRFNLPDRNGNTRGSILMTAQDMFFTPMPAANVADHMRLHQRHAAGGLQARGADFANPDRRADIFFSLVLVAGCAIALVRDGHPNPVSHRGNCCKQPGHEVDRCL